MQKIFSKIVLLAFATLFFHQHSIANTHNNCTLVSNLVEFDTAVKTAIAGDTILLKNGKWNNVELKFYTNGEDGKPVVLMAQNPGSVQLGGNSHLRIYGSYLEVNGLDFTEGSLSGGTAVVEFKKSSRQVANNCRLTNTRISYYNPASKRTEYKWVSVFGIHNRVDHCHFEGKNHEGALLVIWLDGKANYNQIDHNYIGKIPSFGDNGAEAIRIGTSEYSMSESRALVEYNLFDSCDGEIEIISNKSCFNTYRYNTFRNNDGCLTLRHGNDCSVYANFFFGGKSGSGGVRIIGERHKVYNNYFQDLDGDGFRAAISIVNGVANSPINRYFQVKDALVAHNTILNCKVPIAIGAGKNDELSLPPLNCVLANNLVSNTKGSKSVILTDTPINIQYFSNYIFDDNVGVTNKGVINVDPKINSDGVIWRPSADSPVIDASRISYDFIASDIDKQNRTSLPDVGCDEVLTEQVSNKPLTFSDVGINWDL
ncbi:MAG: polysaccharide lyase 6 family protein [Prolixibacteraceae bacterium]